MDYTLLTVVHTLRVTPEKMDARQEQEYYDHAAAAQALPEKAFAVLSRAQNLARALLAVAHSMPRNFRHELAVIKTSS